VPQGLQAHRAPGYEFLLVFGYRYSASECR
jgi:hypothetical protein